MSPGARDAEAGAAVLKRMNMLRVCLRMLNLARRRAGYGYWRRPSRVPPQLTLLFLGVLQVWVPDEIFFGRILANFHPCHQVVSSADERSGLRHPLLLTLSTMTPLYCPHAS